MLYPSDLPQQAFDELVRAIALFALMENHEIEQVAASIETPSMSDSAAMRSSMQQLANIIRSFKED
jgi:hypothetical protein